MDLNTLVSGYTEEAEFDYVGLWQIAQAVHEGLGIESPETIRKISLKVVSRLYDNGLKPGDYDGLNFQYWPDAGRQAMLDRIEREWVEVGTDPNLFNSICYFAPRPPK